MIGRVHIQGHNVAHFLDEQGVGRQFESVGTVRLQAERAPNAADGHSAEPGSFGQAARAPVRLSPGCAFQGPNHHLLDLGIAYLAGCSGSGLVVESFLASFQKSGAPLAHHAQRGPHFPRHRLVVESFGAGQHHARTPRQQGLAARPMGQRLEPLAFLFGQNQSFVWVARSTSGTSLSLPRPAADLDV